MIIGKINDEVLIDDCVLRKEEKNKLILDGWTKERLAEEWVREHIKYNELKEENERLNNIIEEIEECIKQNCEIIRFTDEEGNIVDKIGNIDGTRLLNYIDRLKELKGENYE